MEFLGESREGDASEGISKGEVGRLNAIPDLAWPLIAMQRPGAFERDSKMSRSTHAWEGVRAHQQLVRGRPAVLGKKIESRSKSKCVENMSPVIEGEIVDVQLKLKPMSATIQLRSSESTVTYAATATSCGSKGLSLVIASASLLEPRP